MDTAPGEVTFVIFTVSQVNHPSTTRPVILSVRDRDAEMKLVPKADLVAKIVVTFPAETSNEDIYSRIADKTAFMGGTHMILTGSTAGGRKVMSLTAWYVPDSSIAFLPPDMRPSKM